jgi:hypothetical protein
MAASDSLMELAQRAKVAGDRVAAAKSHKRSDVEREAAGVRDAAQQKAGTGADTAEDAVAAVACAEAALEEAEYAILTAALARMDADAATKQHSNSRSESSLPGAPNHDHKPG